MKVKEKEKSDYTHAIKYTGLFGGVQGLNLLASLIRNKLVALLLGSSGLGLISIYNTLITLMSNATNLGISFSSVRNISEILQEKDEDSLKRYISVVRSWSILTAVLGIMVCIFLSPCFSLWNFGNYDYTLAFVCLSPIVGMAAISGGELAILKGIRKLREVALISLVTAFSALLISVPLYFFWGTAGIIPSLLLMALAVMIVTLYYSFRYYPFRMPDGFKKELAQGVGMVKLGVSFIAAGILGSGVEYVVRTFMLKTESLATVGLYSAAYALTVTYAGMIFVAMDTDYFPRISAVNRDRVRLNKLVNRQIEVAVLLIAPLMEIFLIALPVIVPLLYSSEFFPAVRMAECAAPGMLIRAVALPIAYISLAKGDSVMYLIQELVYDVLLVGLVILGFSQLGLPGAGMAISLTGGIHLIVLCICVSIKYGFGLTKEVCSVLMCLLPWAIMTFLLTFMERGWLYWGMEVGCTVVTGCISLYFLHKKTTLLSSFKRRLGL